MAYNKITSHFFVDPGIRQEGVEVTVIVECRPQGAELAMRGVRECVADMEAQLKALSRLPNKEENRA